MRERLAVEVVGSRLDSVTSRSSDSSPFGRTLPEAGSGDASDAVTPPPWTGAATRLRAGLRRFPDAVHQNVRGVAAGWRPPIYKHLQQTVFL